MQLQNLLHINMHDVEHVFNELINSLNALANWFRLPKILLELQKIQLCD